MALGSGFIIDPGGYIVTNNHGVANADKVTVIFQENSQHMAKVIGRDEKTDIALLKIDSNQKLPYGTWRTSDDAKVGDLGGCGRRSVRSRRLGDGRDHLRTRARHQ